MLMNDCSFVISNIIMKPMAFLKKAVVRLRNLQLIVWTRTGLGVSMQSICQLVDFI